MNVAQEAHKGAEQVRKDGVVKDATRILEILRQTKADYPQVTLNHRMNVISDIAQRIILQNQTRF